MDRRDWSGRLSRINTSWMVLRQAHQGHGAEVTAAQQLLMERYGPAARRYLLAAIREPDVADELLQEFGLALVRGEFRHADPQRGRFRDYIKAVLFHLVSKYRKRQRKLPHTLPLDEAVEHEIPRTEALEEQDRQFCDTWREALLARAWDSLRDAQPVLYRVLRSKVDCPQATSEEIAIQLSQQDDRRVSAASVRQSIHRAREQFARLLIEEVARSLSAPTLDVVEEELRELNLLEYCREALYRGE